MEGTEDLAGDRPYPQHIHQFVFSAELCPCRPNILLPCDVFSISITSSCSVFRSPAATLRGTPLLSYGLSCPASYQLRSMSESQLKIRYSPGTMPRNKNLPFWSVSSARYLHSLSRCGASGIATTYTPDAGTESRVRTTPSIRAARQLSFSSSAASVPA